MVGWLFKHSTTDAKQYGLQGMSACFLIVLHVVSTITMFSYMHSEADADQWSCHGKTACITDSQPKVREAAMLV